MHLNGVGLDPSDIAGVIPMGCVLDNYDSALLGRTAAGIRAAFLEQPSDVERFETPENWIAANPSYSIGPHMPYRRPPCSL